METVVEKKIIPAKTYLITKYIASDGREFFNEHDCRSHEKELEIMKHPVVANRIEGLHTFYNEYRATLYYISSKEDYNFLISTWLYNSVVELDSDFYKYGPGWYIFYIVDGGDGPDDYFLLNYNQYELEAEKVFINWKDSIRSKIGG